MSHHVTIQFGFACEDPVNNLRVKFIRGVPHIEIPNNYPNLAQLTLKEILAAVKVSSLFTELTTLNKNRIESLCNLRNLVDKPWDADTARRELDDHRAHFNETRQAAGLKNTRMKPDPLVSG